MGETPRASEQRELERRTLLTQAFFFARELLEAVDRQSQSINPEPMAIWLRLRDADERQAIEQVSPGFLAVLAEMVAILKLLHDAREPVDSERQRRAVDAMRTARGYLHQLPAEYLVGKLPLARYSTDSHPAAGRWAAKRYATRDN